MIHVEWMGLLLTVASSRTFSAASPRWYVNSTHHRWHWQWRLLPGWLRIDHSPETLMGFHRLMSFYGRCSGEPFPFNSPLNQTMIDQSRPVHIFFRTHQRIAVNRPETSPNSFSMFLLSRCPWVCRFFGVASNHHTMLSLDKTTQFGTSNADPNVPMLMLPLFAQVGNRAPAMCSIDSRRKMFYEFLLLRSDMFLPIASSIFINFLSTKSDILDFEFPPCPAFFCCHPQFFVLRLCARNTLRVFHQRNVALAEFEAGRLSSLGMLIMLFLRGMIFWDILDSGMDLGLAL